ncbi:3-oxoacyl-[acyl-carrier-protein] synthase III C-terminal domain-containing protein [Ornithinimicrobium avium]|uniref:3-oxoacyl-ACP synthase n=1 Tax=Ornithinimicrobium avium TaxID=2283195 RepID=A0A345NM02_9MICO|nr:3-oxoacyl-[acyl-carrier-protein] synthase III C-terminal domain-containing protein [Ornithinimicrobium avium]AXH96060.1 3-oxoacyl-ACP synthase [Ornithinimicrobium avium]
MRNCEIAGWGSYLAERVVTFGDQTRYRVTDGVTQLDMLERAARGALDRAGLEAGDVDCVIGAVAADLQPIPCTAALLWERLAPRSRVAAFDVNSTCTSFVTAVDVASRYLADGEYERVLVVSGDVGSRFLNAEQAESRELFSDAAAAVVLTRTEDAGRGVLTSLQRTWAEHAHDTEIRGGGSLLPARDYPLHAPGDHLFDMDGRRALHSMVGVLPEFFAEFFDRLEQHAGLGREDVDLFVPHQASRALGLMMRRIGIPTERYADRVDELGNMVSASVPYVLADCLGSGRVGRGDVVVLCGTAAGLTANALALRL